MRRPLVCGIACVLPLSVSAQSTFNAFDCNRAGDYSTCHVPDGTEISCYNGSYSECRVTHPNGASGESPGPAALLIGALIRLHQEHAAQKAAKEAETAIQVLLKAGVLSSDIAGFWKATTDELLVGQRLNSEYIEGHEKFQREIRQMSGDMYKTATSLVRNLDEKLYRTDTKRSQKIFDLSLDQGCSFWETSKKMTAGFLPIAADPGLPSKWTQWKVLLEAVEVDQASLDAQCTSPEAEKARHRASKLLAHEHPNVQRTVDQNGPAMARKVGGDGTDWGTLTRNQQAFYARGFADGYEQGAMEGGGLDKERRMYTAQEVRAALMGTGAPKSHLTVLFGDGGVSGYQIADAVSTFYKDFRNVRVCWNVALVFSVEALAGEPPTEQRLNDARKVGAEQGCM